MSLQSSKKWVWPKEQAEKENILDQILEKRGVKDNKLFLNPKLKDIPDFTNLYGASLAAEKIFKFASEGKRIVIHGDYDADGVCATSILFEFLFYELSKHINKKIDVLPYIPDRVDQGYGLTQSSIDDCKKLGAELIVTVDCGIRDRNLIEENIKKNKLSFVITDHHQVPSDIDSEINYPVVHQKFPDNDYSDVDICGTFVAFLLVQAIRHTTGMEYEIRGDTLGLDLVAIATVTDIMELTSVNRVVLKFGLEQIKKAKRVGLKKLIEISDLLCEEIESYHLGFIIGPRINASGRIDSALEAVKLLVSKNLNTCDKIASKLNYLNFQRQNITQEALNEARELVEDDKKIICVLGETWHEGIVGLVAGKLNEEYFKPVLVATKGDGEIRGSARSIPGFNITNALEECSTLLTRFGGHEQAAGFSLEEKNWDKFVSELTKLTEEEITEEMLTAILEIDLYLSSNEVTIETSRIIDTLKPFGYKNPKPKIGLKDLVVMEKNIIGKIQNHMKLICKGDSIEPITILMFRCDEDIDTLKVDDKIDLVGDININNWNGMEQIQIIAKEWKFSV